MIKGDKCILLLIDFDGTLTPIVSTPKKALLKKSVRRILKSLSKRSGKFRVGVISGRKLADIKRLIGLNNIYYGGNHGLEITGPGIDFTHPSLKGFRPYQSRIKKDILSKTKGIKGVIVEDKGGSLSLHYRLVKQTRLKELKKIFDAACAPYIKSGKVARSSGKKVWEIRPPAAWNKGKAVGRICASLKETGKRILPIYMGDDKTDEDAFSFLKDRRSITIFVGERRESMARYYLRSPAEVKIFLVRLCRV